MPEHRDIARLLEIEEILDRYPVATSAGQQQRSSLAQALIRQADLFLLDEPMSQLEPQLRAVLGVRIKDWPISRGMTTVFVTHDQTEAIALADRIAVIEKGILQQFVTPTDLKERPANLLVTGFIGEPPELHAALGGRRKVSLGVRPHRVRVGAGPIRGEVFSRQWLGDQTHIGIDLGGRTLIAVTEGAFTGAAVGDRLRVDLPLEGLYLFDPERGAALYHGSRRG